MQVAIGQVPFAKVEDQNNAISQHPSIGAYTGAAWIDFENDGDLDLFVNSNNLYLNQGNDVFVKDQGRGFPLSIGLGNGNTWADIDNDGDLDMFRTSTQSKLLEQVNDTMSERLEGLIGTTIMRGWSAAWGDYDQDGFVDLIVTHPRGFLGPPQNNFLYHNLGDGRFEQVLTSEVVQEFAAFTGANWTDYDLDGDLDLFIGSGEVSAPSPDHLYQNMLMETDTAQLVRITTGALAEDLRDGQNWNLIDFDNDGDLDGYITNYLNSVPNQLYRNDSGTYVLMTPNEVGPIAGQNGPGLANVWEDFDNDGDLDCFVTFDGGWDRLYWNRGDGSFEADSQAVFLVPGASRGPSTGDYDGDGFVDIFISSAAANTVGLYRNQTNSNRWVHFNLKGSISNAAAIGAKVRLKATIFGQTFWQMREISSQNSFCGMNSLTVEFGLGDAMVADSVEIIWPLGGSTWLENVGANQVLTVEEEIPAGFLRANFRLDSLETDTDTPVQFENLSVVDPLSNISYAWDMNGDGITDVTEEHPLYTYADTGWQTISLTISDGQNQDSIRREAYLYVKLAPEDTSATSIAPPNPSGFRLFPFEQRVSEKLQVSYELHQATSLQVAVYQLSGKELMVEKLLRQPGKHRFVWPTDSLAQGMYVLVFQTESGYQEITRFIRQ